METKFKTNIKCGACVETVKPHLDKAVGEENWEVDLKSPDRVLTTQGTPPEKVISALEAAGYAGEKMADSPRPK